MGFRFRKSVNLGSGFRLNFSKSGAGFSWGTKGFRFTKKAGGGTRTTFSIPGTGISHVSGKSGLVGFITVLIIWPLQLSFWVICAAVWLMWKVCYWTAKLFYIAIRYLISIIKNKIQKTENEQL